MSLSLPKAQLIGVFLESLSYGTYLMVFIQCMQVLQRRQSRPSDYLVGTAVSLFILVTAHLVVDLMHTMDAFTSNMDIPDYPIKFYTYFENKENIARNALYVAVTVVSDAFILYRSFIVWRQNYLVVAIPFMLFLADIAIGILWVYTITLVPPGQNAFTDPLAERIKAFYGITLGMNVICTCLIAYKIWRAHRTVAPYVENNQSESSRLVSIIIESASIYSAFLLAMIVTYCGNSAGMFLLLNTICPIIGIVFSSVIVRVGAGLSHGDSCNTGSRPTGIRTQWTPRLSERQTTSDQILSPSSGTFPEHGIQVAMSRSVHTHIDELPAKKDETDVRSVDAKSQSFNVV